MKKKNRTGSYVFLGLIMIFLYAPIVYTIVFSFNEGKSLTKFSGFSLKWYGKMFANNTMMEALFYTIACALLATAISTLVGTVTAIGLSKSKKVLKNVVEQVNQLPIMNPEIVTAIGLLMLFSAVHIEKGFFTMVLAHIMFCIPYVILSVMPKLRTLNPNLAEAAMDLGATPLQALTKVIVPQCMPGIISGALIAFTMSFDDFVISYFVTGNGVSNISILVYTESRRVNPSINALSTLIVVIITVSLILVNVIPALAARKSRKTAGVAE
ncbi:MAG: ABC transporter permease [Lachnospiraceae bacterium]|nr:ABC transporter permease [Lachnospiraceae bacterium]